MAIKKAVKKAIKKPQNKIAATLNQNPAAPVQPRGRPPGKRSDENYIVTSVILERETKLTAQDKARRAGFDLSDACNLLLKAWIENRIDIHTK